MTDPEKDMMLKFFKASFFWQFAAGFVVGTLGIVALQPAEAADFSVTTHVAR